MSDTYPAAGSPVVTETNDPDAIREQIELTRANLSADVNTLADRAKPGNVARRQVDKARDAATGLKDKVMGAAPDLSSSRTGSGRAGSGLSDAASSVGDAASSVGDTASSLPGAARRQTQGNPLAAGVVAFGLGLLVSSLLPAARVEQEAARRVKEQVEPLKETVTDAAKESAQNLRQPAQEAFDSVKQTAQEGVATVQDEGRSAATEVKDQADDSRTTVQDVRQS